MNKRMNVEALPEFIDIFKIQHYTDLKKKKIFQDKRTIHKEKTKHNEIDCNSIIQANDQTK